MRRLSALVAALLCAACGAGPDPAAPARAHPSSALAVTGYALAEESPTVVDRDAAALSQVGVDGVTVTPDGDDLTRPSDDAAALLAQAHRDGLRAELLVSNYSEDLGDFSPAIGAALLTEPAHVDAVADRLVSYVEEQGWDGITLDLESLEASDAQGLVDLATALQERLPEDATVSIDVMASTDAAGYLAAGYHLADLAEQVDVVALMAYDQHGPTWSDAGPIGALRWQRKSLAALLAAGVPAAEVDLGTAGYGYTWPTEKDTGRDVTVAQARRLVANDGATATWDDTAGEWTATLSNGTVVWWDDARSFEQRRALAIREGLHGMALWRLGSADPLTS